MNRDEKSTIVGELNDSFAKAKIAVVAEYHGVKVANLEKLRKELRKEDARIQIAKNTLLRLATKDTPYEHLASSFSGNTAITVGFKEPVGPAKVLAAFAKEFDGAFTLRAGGLESLALSAEDVVALSKLPGRNELLGMLVGVMAAVPTNFVRLLSAVPQKFLFALSAIKEQKEKQ